MNRLRQQHTTDSWINVEPPSATVDGLNTDVNENLLLDAQNESPRTRSVSSPSDSSSPKTPKSPVQTSAEWVSFWSSRIEAEPPKEWKFIHPMNRNAEPNDEDKQLIEKKHVRYLILSNCASFLLGMGIMYLCLRRYFRMKTPYFYSLD